MLAAVTTPASGPSVALGPDPARKRAAREPPPQRSWPGADLAHTVHTVRKILTRTEWVGETGIVTRSASDHRQELADFLRARRESTRPEQVGLPPGRGRRTPGLRREEVAMLAGVSVTWYTWLEQGRRINASHDVLNAIGRALLLDEAGLEHLIALTDPGTAGIEAPTEAPSALRRLIDSLMPAPAYVLGPHWEFVAWNTGEERLYPRIAELEPPRLNLIWVLFCDPDTRSLIVDWDIHARQALA